MLVLAENGSIIIITFCCGCGVADGVTDGVGVSVDVGVCVGVGDGATKLGLTVGVTVTEGVTDGVGVIVDVGVCVGVGVIQLKDCCSSHPVLSTIFTIIIGLLVRPEGISKVRDGGTVVLPE
jgi:hypothetical protein